MPAPHRVLEPCDVVAHLRATCADATGPRLRGIETEWLCVPADDATGPVDFDQLRAAVEPDRALGASSPITFEPGGQVEISTAPASTAAAAVRAAVADTDELRRRAARAGVELVGLGLDWQRPLRRVLTNPRYAAMEQFFDGGGPHGRRMMCGTASVQPNIPLGPDAASRWRTAHLLGPMLAAAFANSPLCGSGLPSGWQSARLATWWAMDPTRTTAALHDPDVPPAAAWASYVLDAHVMLIRSADGRHTAVDERLPFHEWLRDGHPLGWPTLDDVDYHLTTLFPPVRLRGWLELRMVDALPDPWWPVPLLVTDAVLDDPDASAVATEACTPVEGRWVDAARAGLGDAALACAAVAVFTAALDALRRKGTPPDLVRVVAAYADRYALAGRAPADDRLDEWTAAGGHAAAPVGLVEPSWT